MRKKSLCEYTNKDISNVLETYELLSNDGLLQICAEILRRMNHNKDLLPEKKWEHKGPLC